VNATEHTACTQIRLTPEQQQLVTDHTHIVPAIAKQLMKRFSLPSWIDLSEMVACGYLGLCNAALKFDPALGRFETYASWKVRGAIIDDFLRRQAPVMQSTEPDPLDENEPIDPTPSAEETLIEAQERGRKCRHLAFASKSVTAIELRAATSKHSHGKTLREIGAAEGRSASWAHYRVHCGERQLREALLATGAE